MVARLKDRGVEELQSFRRRVLRIAGLGRISKGDADRIIRLVDEIEAIVIRMDEKPNKEANWW